MDKNINKFKLNTNLSAKDDIMLYEKSSLAPWKLNLKSMQLEFPNNTPTHLGIDSNGTQSVFISLNTFTQKFVHPDDQPIIENKFSQAIRNITNSQYSDSFEYRLIRADGTVRNILVNSYLDNDDEIIGASQDITDLKSIENAAIQNEELYLSLVSNMPNIVLIHVKNTIVYINNAVHDILGYFPADMIGEKIDLFISQESLSSVSHNIKYRQADKKVDAYEIKIFTKNGEKKHFLVRGNSVNYKGNKALLILLIDLTERIKSEQQYKHLNHELIKINSANNLIFDSISQTVTSQLEQIKSCAQTLLHSNTIKDMAPEMVNNLKIINHNSILTELKLNAITWWAKIIADKFQIKPLFIDSAPIINSILKELKLCLVNKQLNFNYFDFTNIVVYCDHELLNNILRLFITKSIFIANNQSDFEFTSCRVKDFIKFEIKVVSSCTQIAQIVPLQNINTVTDIFDFGSHNIKCDSFEFIVLKKFINLIGGEFEIRNNDIHYDIQISLPNNKFV